MEIRRAMLLRLFDDTSDIFDSTNKNSHTHRDANLAAQIKKEVSTEDVVMAEDELQVKEEVKEEVVV